MTSSRRPRLRLMAGRRPQDRPPIVVLDPDATWPWSRGDCCWWPTPAVTSANWCASYPRLPASGPAAGLGHQRDPAVPLPAGRGDGAVGAGVAPRDVRNVVRCFGVARKMLRHRPAMVVSTGSGIALGLPARARRGRGPGALRRERHPGRGPVAHRPHPGQVPTGERVHAARAVGQSLVGATPDRCSRASPPCPARRCPSASARWWSPSGR